MKEQRISFENISEASGRIEYLHNGKDLGSGAFDIKAKATLNIFIPRYIGASEVYIQLYNESMSELLINKKAQFDSTDYINDKYVLDLDTTFLGIGLYFFNLRFISCVGALFGYSSYRDIKFTRDNSGKMFQVSVVDFDEPRSTRYRGGIIYQIFPDRFSKGGIVTKREDAILIDDWYSGIPEYPEYPGAELKNNTFFGGTLYGIIDKLDYIKSLGVNLIYLNPIFEAYSNHKYDTGNYMKVDDMFGSDAAFEMLIKEAEKRGIDIILDGVFNHTGDDSIYFNRKGRYENLGAYQSSDSIFYSWYDFKEHPDNYTCWWNIQILPRINPDIPSCGDYIAGDGGVIEKYIKMGACGFRLDVADELSDSFIERIKKKIKDIKKDGFLIGEVWEDASNKISYGKRKRYLLGNELDSVMNYPLRRGLINFLKGNGADDLRYSLSEVLFNAPLPIQHRQMNILGTHDTERIITLLGSDSWESLSNDELAKKSLTKDEKDKGTALLKLAVAALWTLPGLPTIYYGDEAGLEGYRDPFNRMPYPWGRENMDILDFYKTMGSLRINNKCYKDGRFDLYLLTDDILVFTRSYNDVRCLTLINRSDKSYGFSFDSNALSLISGKRSKSFTLSAVSFDIIKTNVKNFDGMVTYCE